MRALLITLLIFLGLGTSCLANNRITFCENINSVSCGAGKRFAPVVGGLNQPAQVNFPIRIDQGSVGDLSNLTATQGITEVLNLWNNLPSSKINFQVLGSLGENIDSLNELDALVNDLDTMDSNPIILDDGTILDQISGAGARNQILAIATPFFFVVANNEITRSFSLYNGFLFSQEGLAQFGESMTQDEILNTFKTTVLHEEGHKVGLDHVQGAFIDDVFEGTKNDQFPIMFPSSVNPNVTLLTDDIALMSTAYPSASFDNNFGTIAGFARKSDGSALLGMNIVAYNLSDPQNNFVSVASDERFNFNGEFSLGGLSPGEYVLKIEPIFSTFSGGSGVGPHDPNQDINPINGFYNGNGEDLLEVSLDEALTSALRINVAAGQTLDNILFEQIIPPFELRGKAVNETISLTNKVKKNKVRLNIKPLLGERTKVLLTVPDEFRPFVKFSRDQVLTKKRKATKVTVKLAKFNTFLEAFPELNNNILSIPITATDLNGDFAVVNTIEVF